MFFGLFRKKKSKDKDVYSEKFDGIDYAYASLDNDRITKQELKAIRKEDYRTKKIKEICNQIVLSNEKVNESITKFKAICDRLNDIELIKNANEERKNKLFEIASKVLNLSNERKKYEKNSDLLAIDTNHYLILERNETSMINEIKKLEEYEREYLTIRSNLNKLEGERANINYDKNKYNTHKNLLKYYVRLLIGISIILFVTFGILAYNSLLPSMVPVLITVTVIACNAVYVVLALRKNAYNLEALRLKENKLISLFNKTKIKYVNSVRVVEYVHRKFDVKNCRQLKTYWDTYLKEKDRKFKYNRNTEMMEIHRQSLMNEFQKIGIKNINRWKDNVAACKNVETLDLYEEKLNELKKEVKKEIEYNKHLVMSGMKNINTIINANSEYKEEIISILHECNVEL